MMIEMKILKTKIVIDSITGAAADDDGDNNDNNNWW